MNLKYTAGVILFLLVLSTSVSAQIGGIFGDEPTGNELGAPLYPGAVYIRKTIGIDPYHETAMYLSLVPMEMVEEFFERKLPEKRVVYYDDKEIYLTVFLLKTWSKFPRNPLKDDLSRLESELCVRVYFYNPNLYEPLAEYFDKMPEGKLRANAVRNGKTMILYTYGKSEEYKSSMRIAGRWKEVSRDIDMYFGSMLEFGPDSTYTFTFTPDNLEAMVKNSGSNQRFKGKNAGEIKKYFEERNPETGRDVIMKNTITMVSENPVDGIKTKSGLADVGSATLSLELINKPRLTFLLTSIE